MASTTRAKKGSKKAPQKAAQKAAGPVPVSRSKTTDQAKKLALAVIREYGLPKEIEQELLEAGVAQDVIDRIGGYHFAVPWERRYKSKKK